MKQLNSLEIPASVTLEINSMAAARKQTGQTVYNLAAGQAIIPSSKHIISAAEAALKQDKTLYPPVPGLPELRESVAKWMNSMYACNYNTSNVLVTVGGKAALYYLSQILLSKGDELLIVAPYWVTYPNIALMASADYKVIASKPETNWKLTPEDLRQSASLNSKAIVLNNASNPAGVLYSKKELHELLKTAAELDLYVISDEVYSGLVYDDNQFVSLGEFSEFQDRVFIIQSCSKNFGMTGWRVGFLLGDKTIIEKASALQGQSTSGTASISQYAALGAINNYAEIIPHIQSILQSRRNKFAEVFNEQFNANIQKPKSGLYVYLSLREFGTQETNSVKFCKDMLEKAGVAMVPGEAFGTESYVRCSIGIPEEEIVLALKAIKRVLS